jgi:thymidylate kinase
MVHPVRRPRGSILAVVGPDGVGKSTFIALLQSELTRVLSVNAESVIVEHFRPNVLPNIKKAFSGKDYDPTREEFTSPHRAKPASLPSSLLRLSYYWLDYVIGYWLSIRPRCVDGKFYIFDRYFYDFVVDPFRSRVKLPDWLRLLFLRATPEPDTVFFLHCDATTVFQRKQELTMPEIERQLDVYQSLARKNKRFVTLDARKSPQTLCDEASQYLVERYFRRSSKS